MREEVRLGFYAVRQCGYFLYGESDTPAFGNLQQVLEDLQTWGGGRNLLDTKTFDARRDQLPVYLLDIRRVPNSEAWVIALWNETPSYEDQVASLMPTSTVGSVEVAMNEIPPGSIPGYATYFAFVPSRSLAVGLRFQHETFGNAGMRAFLRGFMRLGTRHTVFGSSAEGADINVIGYAEAPGARVLKARARFRTEPQRKEAERGLLLERARSVTKVVRKTGLQPAHQENLAFWQRLLRHAGLREPARRPDEIKVQYVMEARLEPDDMQRVFEEYDHGPAESEWEDIGFVLKGDAATTHWLSAATPKLSLDVDVHRDNVEVVDCGSLAGELERHIPSILRALE